MKQKRRISTTISLKHWELLNKFSDKYDTYQRVLELALDCLENGSNYRPALSREEELWMRIGRDIKSACLIPKDGYKVLIADANLERFKKYVADQKPLEYMLEDYCQKPLKECGLKEIMEAIVITGKVMNSFDIINYTDSGDHYTLKMTHEMGLKNSEIVNMMIGSVFKTYGAKIESKVSERVLFINVFKN